MAKVKAKSKAKKITEVPTVTRTITIPVAAPVDMDWNQLRDLLVKSFQKATRVSNLAASWLFTHDPAVGHRKEDGKFPSFGKMPDGTPLQTALNRVAKEWVGADGDTRGTEYILQRVSKVYGRNRFQVVHAGAERSLPTYKFPQPYPLDAERAMRFYRDGDSYFVKVKLLDQWVALRLRSGRDMHRTTRTIDRIISGDLKYSASLIDTVPANEGDHRGHVVMPVFRKTGQTIRRVVIRVPVNMPIQAKRERRGTLVVRSRPTSLMVAGFMGDQGSKSSWWVNGDDAKRQVIAYTFRRQRLTQDYKSERRSGTHGRLSGPLARMSDKQNRWLDNYTHTISRQLANYADRQGVAEVVGCFDDKSFLPQFPWYKLEDRIRQKLTELGIRYETPTERAARLKGERDKRNYDRDVAVVAAALNQLMSDERFAKEGSRET